jgi:putative hydrolase of the HAD superfamily
VTMPPGRTEVVVFDVDDTLYLEHDYVRSGFHAVDAWATESLGIHGFEKLAWTAFEDGVRGSIFDAALIGCGLEPTPELIARLVGVYREHTPAIGLLPDAAACLGALKGRARLAVVSDGPLQSQLAKVRALGLEALVDEIVLTEELGAGFGKPNPRAFELVEERLGAAGGACVYVADNPAKDFDGPAGRGWRTVRIRRAGGLHRDVPNGIAVSAELEDLSALPALLGLDEPVQAERR